MNNTLQHDLKSLIAQATARAQYALNATRPATLGGKLIQRLPA